jgi:hypothetical protein
VLIRGICGKNQLKINEMETYQFISEKNLDQFNQMISAKTRNGFVIVEHNEKLPYVVLSKEKKAIKHSLHLFLTCLTLGLWSIVWIYLIVTLSQKTNILVAVDEDGNLFEDKCLSA